MTINPFLLTSAELLAEWKNLRRNLPDLSLDLQLRQVAHFFAQAPMLVRSSYDRTALGSWPSPWEMMTSNKWCVDSIAVGMDFTLRLSGMTPDRLAILHITDPRDRREKLVLRVDDHHLLNYEHKAVYSGPVDSGIILRSWTYGGRGYN